MPRSPEYAADYERAVRLDPGHAESYESRIAAEVKDRERKLFEESERKRLLDEAAAQKRLEEPAPRKTPKKKGGGGFRTRPTQGYGGKPEWYSSDPG